MNGGSGRTAPKSTAGGVEAVERALSLLSCFTAEEAELSLAELARRSGFYKSTILRLAVSLERFGYFERGEDGRFRLGAAIGRLTAIYGQNFSLAEALRRELQALVALTGETASFYVREGDSRVCLFRENSPKAMRHHIEEGTRLPMTAGASARVLAAFGAGDDPKAPAIRAAGFYISNGERDPDIAAVSVPLFDAEGALRGALAVSGPIARMDDRVQEIAVSALRDSAGRLADAIPVKE